MSTSVPARVHRFNLGDFKCVVLCDGERQISGGMGGFVNADPAEVAATAAAYTAASGDPADRISMNILFVDTGRNRVLIDTGNGPTDDPEQGLLARLAEAGIAPESIDTVILTHGHGDHIQANATADGQPTFPHARYLISAPEWEHWTREPGEAARAHLLAIQERVERVAPDAQLVPGIRGVPAPGHTPGQMALLIESGDARLLHVADAFHHPVELPRPEWYFAFDHDPEQTVATRRQLLDLAARENLLVLPYHFGFPGLGRVRAEGEAWTWVVEPVG
jgi:glyoxylase-like metal-dependent hydrolase (beta-lactamase superfamily II)